MPTDDHRPGVPEVICKMEGVRGSDRGFPVQLVRTEDSGRLAIRGINEGGFSCVDVDLIDLLEWLRRMEPRGVDVDAITRALATVAAQSRSS